jgi:putative endonuclease
MMLIFWRGPNPSSFLSLMSVAQNKRFYVYILASQRNGTLYTGVTSNLQKRVWEHKNHLVEGFTKKYKVDLLVYFEVFENAEQAIIREKRLKRWRRSWKLDLIEKGNPGWEDLSSTL